MELLADILSLRRAIQAQRDRGGRVGLVPTMGALHQGHISLVGEARRRVGPAPSVVVMSVFVNPTQFNNPSDLAKYPRTLESDTALAKANGVDFLFAPTAEEMYGGREGQDLIAGRTRILAGSAATNFEGLFRPGHFDGVTTVVGMLFNIVQPDVACFGEKDFQQLKVIEQMVRELHLPVEIVPCPTLRDPDGLAMSSRNTRLNREQRQRALAIPEGLNWIKAQVEQGRRDLDKLCAEARRRLEAAGLKVEYLQAADPQTLAEVKTPSAQILVAAWCDDVRLIDNIAV